MEVLLRGLLWMQSVQGQKFRVCIIEGQRVAAQLAAVGVRAAPDGNSNESGLRAAHKITVISGCSRCSNQEHVLASGFPERARKLAGALERPQGDQMATLADRAEKFRLLEVPLERDVFMRTLIRHLAGTLEEVVGLDEANGFISIVGQQMGEELGREYRKALKCTRLTASEVGDVLIDLKRRISGDFSIVEESEGMLLLTNRACPFGDRVIGRPSMCMMTSNVFGSIAAENLGYAKVELRQTIAQGHDGCLIAVYLDSGLGSEAEGREYFAD